MAGLGIWGSVRGQGCPSGETKNRGPEPHDSLNS